MKTVLRILLPVIVVALGIGGFALLKSSAPVDHPLEPSARVWSVAGSLSNTNTYRLRFVSTVESNPPGKLDCARRCPQTLRN
ncbi:MAG: hypothetical protein Ct9H300mP14_02960 [Gammaproteobacteria bacterium]|nr:MAG: hypothetical protein Ct9H300mP14_02960 [Gammaproteobacteria bacterium]